MVGTAAALATVYVFLRVVLPLTLPDAASHLTGGQDFRVFHSTARHFLRGGELYRVALEWSAHPTRVYPHGLYFYPPPSVLLFVPFALLPYKAAAIAWTLMNYGLLVPIVFFLGRLSLPPGRDPAVSVALVVVWLTLAWPLTWSLYLGQVSVMVLFCLAGGLYFLERRRPWACAFLLVGAAMLKVIGAFPLLYLARCKWRKMAAPTALLLLLPLGTMPREWGVYVRHVMPMQSTIHRAFPRFVLKNDNQSVYALLSRTLTRNTETGNQLHRPLLRDALWRLWSLTVLGTVLWVVLRRPRSEEQAVLGAIALIVAPLLAHPVCFSHYSLWLGPQFVVLARATTRLKRQSWRLTGAAVLAAGVLLVSLPPDLVFLRLLRVDVAQWTFGPWLASYPTLAMVALFVANLWLFWLSGRTPVLPREGRPGEPLSG